MKKAAKHRKKPNHRLPTPFSWLEFGIVLFCTYGLCLAATLFAWYRRDAPASGEIVIADSRLLQLVVAEILLATLLGAYLAWRGWRMKHLRMGFSIVSALKGMVLLIASVMLCSSVYALAFAIPAVTQTLSQTSFSMQLTLSAVLITSVVNPVFEEVLHLGYVQQRLAARGPLFAIGISTLLRTLMHVHRGPFALVDIVPIGILYGCVFWYSRRLFPIIVAHALMDFMALAGLIR